MLAVRGTADVDGRRREARTGAPVLAARAISLSPYQPLSVTHRETDRTPPFDTHAPTVRSRCGLIGFDHVRDFGVCFSVFEFREF